jgi:glycosyltransferase involved in cell wall biosynthesis
LAGVKIEVGVKEKNSGFAGLTDQVARTEKQSVNPAHPRSQDRSMKVCLVTGEYSPMQGGVGDFTNELGQALAALGHEVHVITSASRSTEHATRNTVIVHRSVRGWDWACWRDIIRLLDKTRPDIVNIQYQTAAYGMHPAINFLPLRLKTGTGYRTVVTFHDLKVPYLFPKAGPLRWWVNLALARWSDAVVVTNAEDFTSLSTYSFIRSLSLIPIGSNIHPEPPPGYDRESWRAHWDVKPDDLLLSYFGFLNESKGAETLVRALARLVQGGYNMQPASNLQPPTSNLQLMMVGGKVGSSDPTNVAYLKRIVSLIEELGLTDRVLWTGYTPQSEVSANLLASDICVLPYRDGASFRRGSFMAALAHGLPIVSTRPRVDVPELRHGENILLVPPNAPVALAEAIARLAADTELRRRLGEGAAGLAQDFTWEKIAEKTKALYEEILSPICPSS